MLSKGTPLRALYAYDVPRSPAVELSILAMVALAIPEKAAHGDTTAEMARCARATPPLSCVRSDTLTTSRAVQGLLWSLISY